MNAQLLHLPEQHQESKWLQDRAAELMASGALTDLGLTDEGCAERFRLLHGSSLRYCPAFRENGWFTYKEESYWEQDSGGLRALQLTGDVARLLHIEATSSPASKDLGRAALKYEDAGPRQSILKLAKAKFAVDVQDFDRDPWLLNVIGGTVDLNSGKIRPAQREDLITKRAPVEYDPHADAPTWGSFLYRSLKGNRELMDFIWRACGYAATGLSIERVLLMLIGGGGSGKSTFLRTLQEFLGTYAKQADPNLLIASRSKNDAAAIASLAGRRFVATVEVPQSARIAEQLVKSLTGNDIMEGRRLYENPFEIEPTWTIFQAANHKPKIQGRDEAIWQRVRLVPFDNPVPEDQQDKHFLDKLRAEFPGILNWLISGCLEWQEVGLTPPAEVRDATNSYRNETDDLGDFLDRYEVCPGASTPCQAVFDRYIEWAGEGHEKALGRNRLYRELEGRCWERRKISGIWCWDGRREA